MSENRPKGIVMKAADAERLVAQLARGAAGVAKALLGVDKAPDDVAAARLLACSRCVRWTGHRCELCGCFTQLKVRIRDEACPQGWWLPVGDDPAGE